MLSQVPVAHAYNSSYLGGTDKDCHSKPTWENSLQVPILKIPNTKKAWQNGTSGRAST
jgi:hypothetical protein